MKVTPNNPGTNIRKSSLKPMVNVELNFSMVNINFSVYLVEVEGDVFIRVLSLGKL